MAKNQLTPSDAILTQIKNPTAAQKQDGKKTKKRRRPSPIDRSKIETKDTRLQLLVKKSTYKLVFKVAQHFNVSMNEACNRLFIIGAKSLGLLEEPPDSEATQDDNAQ